MNITLEQPYAISEKGGRVNNEDSIFPLSELVDSGQKLFIVCDGVGGAEKGEIASSLACDSFQTFFSTFIEGDPTEKLINKAVQYTEVRFDEYVALHTEAKGMATTLTMIYVRESGITIAHIGDSRIYQFRERKGDLSDRRPFVSQFMGATGETDCGRSPAASAEKCDYTRDSGIRPSN